MPTSSTVDLTGWCTCQRRFCRSATDRRRRHAEQGERAAGDAAIVVELHTGDRARDGEVAVPAGELGDTESAGPAPDREVDSRQQLVRFERRGPEPLEELGGGDATGSRLGDRFQLGVEGDGDGWVLGGRVGVGERAPDRATVADLEVTDVAASPSPASAPPWPRRRRARCAASMRRRADRHAAVPAPYPTHLGDRPDVDQVGNGRQPQRHHRHQALAAGDDLGLVAELVEQPDRFGDACRRVVLEPPWLQRVTQANGRLSSAIWPPWASNGSSVSTPYSGMTWCH